MQEYVLGFVFDRIDPDLTLLIRKNRPEWVAGKLNGIGGKREEEEPIPYAMIRGASEEASINDAEWTYLGKISGKDFRIYMYRADVYLSGVQQMESEELVVRDYRDIEPEEVVGNIMWLLPYARYFDREGGETTIDVWY